jgi:hypothetical protein
MDEPSLSFPNGFDEHIEYEAEQKGYWSRVAVRVPTGAQYTVHFYDPITLSQNLKVVQEAGRSHVAMWMVTTGRLNRLSSETVCVHVHSHSLGEHLTRPNQHLRPSIPGPRHDVPVDLAYWCCHLHCASPAPPHPSYDLDPSSSPSSKPSIGQHTPGDRCLSRRPFQTIKCVDRNHLTLRLTRLF